MSFVLSIYYFPFLSVLYTYTPLRKLTSGHGVTSEVELLSRRVALEEDLFHGARMRLDVDDASEGLDCPLDCVYLPVEIPHVLNLAVDVMGTLLCELDVLLVSTLEQ